MLLFILSLLEGVKIPAVFTYCSTRMALAAITSLLVTIFFGKVFIKKLYEWKVGDRVRSEDCPLLGELHRNKNDTPTMGGILILFALLVSLGLWMDFTSPLTWMLGATTVVIGALGAIDDYLKLRYKNKKGVPGKVKLLVQGLFSLAVVVYFLKTQPHAAWLFVPFFKDPFVVGSALVMGLFMMVVITGASNAVNLTDGLDGLATGTVMMAAAAFAIIAFISNNADLSRYLHIVYIEGSSEIAIYLAAVCGACLGFLWYNGYPAQVFMGDTGSLTLGAILGVSAVLLKREILLGVIGGVFVVEALSVMLQVGSYKLRDKKRLFLCAPLHHHFEYKGWPETKVVLRFWIIGLLLAIIGIATLKFQ